MDNSNFHKNLLDHINTVSAEKKERESFITAPFYYEIVKIFTEKTKEFFGEYSIAVDGEDFNFTDSHDYLFKGNGNIKKTFQVDRFGPVDGFRIELREFEGIQYLAINHYNEMISGCYFKIVSTKRGDLSALLLKSRRFNDHIQKPILSEEVYNKTVGSVMRFLKNRKQVKKMGVVANKGLLLWGTPGNGKTLISAYIKDYCKKRGYSVNVVNLKKIGNCDLGGDVLIMDDFSIDPLVKRNEITDILLSEMDGPNKEGGRVYIITTNELKEKDRIEEALIRPGRIDSVIKIEPPTKELSLKYVKSWKLNLPQEMCQEIIDKTSNWSFAQLNYLQTEMVLSYIEGKKLNVDEAIEMCHIKIKDNVKGQSAKPSIGFSGFDDF